LVCSRLLVCVGKSWNYLPLFIARDVVGAPLDEFGEFVPAGMGFIYAKTRRKGTRKGGRVALIDTPAVFWLTRLASRMFPQDRTLRA